MCVILSDVAALDWLYLLRTIKHVGTSLKNEPEMPVRLVSGQITKLMNKLQRS